MSFWMSSVQCSTPAVGVMCACLQRSLQGKLEAAYLSAEGKEREHELKRDAATSKHSQVSNLILKRLVF